MIVNALEKTPHWEDWMDHILSSDWYKAFQGEDRRADEYLPFARAIYSSRPDSVSVIITAPCLTEDPLNNLDCRSAVTQIRYHLRTAALRCIGAQEDWPSWIEGILSDEIASCAGAPGHMKAKSEEFILQLFDQFPGRMIPRIKNSEMCKQRNIRSACLKSLKGTVESGHEWQPWMGDVLLNEFACMDDKDSQIEHFLEDVYALRPSVAAPAFWTATTSTNWHKKRSTLTWEKTDALPNVVYGLVQFLPYMKTAAASTANYRAWQYLYCAGQLFMKVLDANHSQSEKVFEGVQQFSGIMADALSTFLAEGWTPDQLDHNSANTSIQRIKDINASFNRTLIPARIMETLQRITGSGENGNKSE